MTRIDAFRACSGRNLFQANMASLKVGKSVETAPLCNVAGLLPSIGAVA
jgi:hypothetical protein